MAVPQPAPDRKAELLSEDMDDSEWQARSVFVSNLPETHRTGGMVFGMVKRIGTVTSIRNGSSGTDNPHFTIISFLMPQAAREAAEMLKKPSASAAIPPGLETSAVTPGHVEFARGRVGRAFTPRSTLPVARQLMVNTGPEAAPKPGQNAHRSANKLAAGAPADAAGARSRSPTASHDGARQPYGQSEFSKPPHQFGPLSPGGPGSSYPQQQQQQHPHHHQSSQLQQHPPQQFSHQHQQHHQPPPSQHLFSPSSRDHAMSSYPPHHDPNHPPLMGRELSSHSGSHSGSNAPSSAHPHTSGYNGAPPPPPRTLEHQSSREFRSASTEPNPYASSQMSSYANAPSSQPLPIYPPGSNLAPNPQAPPFVPTGPPNGSAPGPPGSATDLQSRLAEAEANLAAATAAASRAAHELTEIRKAAERKERDQEAELSALRRRLDEAKKDGLERQMRAGTTQRLVERLAKDDDKIASSLSLIENLAHRARINPGPAGVLPPVPAGFDLSRLDQPGPEYVVPSSFSTSFQQPPLIAPVQPPTPSTTTPGTKSDSTRKRARSPSPNSGLRNHGPDETPTRGSTAITGGGEDERVGDIQHGVTTNDSALEDGLNNGNESNQINQATGSNSASDSPSVRKSARLSIDGAGRGITASGSLSSLSGYVGANEYGQRDPSVGIIGGGRGGNSGQDEEYNSNHGGAEEPMTTAARLPPRLRPSSQTQRQVPEGGSEGEAAAWQKQVDGGATQATVGGDDHGSGRFGARVKKAFGF